jgi:hypothetical protein
MTAAGRLAGGVALSVALVLVLGACGGGSKVSAASLKPRLLPASSLPGYTSVASLDWSDPIDLVGQGVPIPETTYPSAAVKEFRSAHLKGAAGEVLRRGSGLNETNITVGVAEFGSTSDATKMQSWMHSEDLQQPCFGACVFSPEAVKLSGIPGASAVIQTVPNAKPSDQANYRAEFTIDKYLYWGSFSGDTSATTKSAFEAGIAAYYRHAKQTS